MKKLLIAMMSVASLAFISKAETFTGTTGTSFESLTIGQELSVGQDDAGSTAGKKLWSSTAESVGVVTNANLEGWTAAKPAIAGSTDEKALMVEAESRLVRSIDVVENTGASISYDIGSGIYFDTMVQFTATDTAPTPESGDKLVVWLYGSAEEDGAFGVGTNLVVTAGYLSNTENSVDATNYIVTTATEIQPNSWHRLTIKSIDTISSTAQNAPAGFVVFIDGAEVASTATKGVEGSAIDATMLNATSAKWANKNALFPSLVKGNANGAHTLTSVSLEGTGMIDDITFTSDAPNFAIDAPTVVITWGEGIEGVQYKVGSSEELIDATNGSTITLPAAGTITVSASYVTGYVPGTWLFNSQETTLTTFDISAPAEIVVVAKKKLISAGGTTFGSAAELAAWLTAEAQESFSGTVTLLGNVSVGGTIEGDAYDYLGTKAEGQNIVIDLAGYDIVGTNVDAQAALANLGGVLTITNSTTKIGHIRMGVTSEDALYPVYCAAGTTYIQSAVVDGLVAVTEDAQLVITGGSFSGEAEEFYLASRVAEGLEATYSAGYWTVGEGGEQPPEPTTYKLTIPEVANATAAVTAGGETVADLTKIAENTDVTVTWTAAAGYKITAGATETITMTADTTAATPTVTAITYATVTITQVDNCTITVKHGMDTVESGAKFDVDAGVKLTVTRTVAEGYELDNCEAEEAVVVTADTTITAKVKSTTPAEKDYPAYIAEGDKGKYDTWAETYKIEDRKDTAAALQNAYLLNVDPDDATTEAAKFACVSITVNGTSVTVTASATNSEGNAYNGTVEIKGSATLTGEYTLPADSTAARFFKAFLK